jgi:nucleotide-binding universal stress UspA family protein
VTDFISTTAKHATSYLEHLSERVWSELHERLSTTVVQGNAAEKVVEAAGAQGDLIVMTSHGRGGLKRAVFGSVATAVIRQAHAPVLLVPARVPAQLTCAAPLFRQVVIAIDESDHSEEVIPFAVGLGQLGAADYTFLEVVVNQLATDAGVRLSGDTELHAEQARAAAVTHVGRVARRLEQRARAVFTAVVDHRDAARAILEYVDSTQADLLALTTHGRTGIRRMVLGSVAEEVARASDVPVLLYRA